VIKNWAFRRNQGGDPAEGRGYAEDIHSGIIWCE